MFQIAPRAAVSVEFIVGEAAAGGQVQAQESTAENR
jgi:hypothetical protein